jgi:leucyl aminopeptidase
MKIEEIIPSPTIILKTVDDLPGEISSLVFEYAENFDLAYPTGKKLGAVTVLPVEKNSARFIVSLGDKKKADADTFRKAGASFARWCNTHAVKETGLDFSQSSLNAHDDYSTAVLEGLCFGGFEFNRYKTRDLTKRTVTTVFIKSIKDDNSEKKIEHAVILGEAVDLARDWIHEPANTINPQSLEDRVKTVASAYGLSMKVLHYDELVSMGAGGLTAVGRGSQNKPRLLIVEYKGNGSEAPIALVGKAITFDTGGYSLKPSDFIVGMKYDKAGGISVLATVIAAARLKLKANLVAVIPVAENMISDEAYRPDDILSLLSGLTVEIVSTDAEGRLILADALFYAQKELKPRAIMDIATLTGGVKVALGTHRAGLLSNSDKLAEVLYKAGETTGEKLWRLPMDDEYFDLIKSEDADMKNSGPREAQTIVGAIFLKQFVADEVPWAHLDIAATGEVDTEKPWSPKGANGFGVRLMLEAVEKLLK